MFLCDRCAELVRFSFPKKQLKDVDVGHWTKTRCGHCQRSTYCGEYELKDKRPVSVVTPGRA